jgi:hypothetical protein
MENRHRKLPLPWRLPPHCYKRYGTRDLAFEQLFSSGTLSLASRELQIDKGQRTVS